MRCTKDIGAGAVLLVLIAVGLLSACEEDQDGQGAAITQAGVTNSYDLVGEWGGPAVLTSLDALAAAQTGEVYVVDLAAGKVITFNSNGKVFAEWDISGAGVGPGPVDMAIDAHGTVYISDTSSLHIYAFDRHGQMISKWGGIIDRDGGEPRPFDPVSIATRDEAVDALVIDPDPVWTFNSKGELVERWASALPVGERLAIASWQDEAYILIASEKETSIFRQRVGSSEPPEEIAQFSSEAAEPGEGDTDLGIPTDMAVSDDGLLFVASAIERQVAVLDQQGKVIDEWSLRNGDPTGFERISLALGPNGEVYVADDQTGQVLTYRTTE